ncbi:MAG: hypothetical protein V3V05_07515 [Pontiella sp.]
MKKLIRVLLALFIVGGFNAIAEEAASSVTDTDGVNTQPAAEQTIVTDKKQPAAKPQSSIKNNIFYGGYINLSFGSYKVIGIEPMIGYTLTPKLSTGVKVKYNYIQDDRYARSYTTSTYGGSIFARYRVTPKFYAQLEPATYSYESFHLNGTSERDWVPFFLMGGGFTQPLGERSWLFIEVLFDVLQDNKSPYDDWEPFFSIGAGTGF